MILVELALVIGLVWALVHVTLRLVERTRATAATDPGTAAWRIAHFDTDGETRIVLQRQDRRGQRVGTQHVVSTVRLDDPDYEAGFLAGMEAARQRRALFEAEEYR